MSASTNAALDTLRHSAEVHWLIALNPEQGLEHVLHQRQDSPLPHAGVFALLGGILSAAEALAGSPPTDLQISHPHNGILSQAHPSGYHLILSHDHTQPIGPLKLLLKELASQWQAEQPTPLADPFAGLT
jgi:hypothetical protein